MKSNTEDPKYAYLKITVPDGTAEEQIKMFETMKEIFRLAEKVTGESADETIQQLDEAIEKIKAEAKRVYEQQTSDIR